MRLVIDMDEVLYDFEGAARFLIEERFGVVVPPSESWTYAREWLADHYGSEKPWHWLWKGGVDKGLFRHGHVKRGAFRGIHTLHKAGHELVLITSRPQRAASDTLEWLGFHRLPFTEVHILGPGRRKTDIKPHADLYVDDAAHNIDDVLNRTSGAWGVLWNAQWNESYGAPPFARDRFVRAETWEDVHKAVAEREAQKNRGGWV